MNTVRIYDDSPTVRLYENRPTIVVRAPGPQGEKGLKGDPNTLTVGTVTTGAAGSAASAAIGGTAPNQTLDLTIPQGLQGIQGLKGDKGDQGDLAYVPPNTALVAGTYPPNSSWVPSTRNHTLAGNIIIGAPTSNPGSAKSGTATLVLKQAATGGPFTVTWDAVYEWASDAPGPTMPTAANAELIVHLFWTGFVWRGMVGGVFYP